MEEPKIRFKGFQEEWKKKNIGSSCSISIGEFVIKTKQRANAPYPVYNGGSTNTGYYDQYNQIGPKVIVSARGANAGFVNKEEGKYWAGNSCYSIGTKDETNWLFLYYAFKFYQDKYIKAQQAANIPSVSKSDIQKTILLFPSINEQQSIASYFQHLDALIQSTTKKIESLKQVKAASLQSMFPQERETTPRVRFKGFEGEWNTPSISEVFELRNGYTPSKAVEAFWEGGTIPWFRMEDIRENGGILNDAIQHISPLGIKGKGVFEKNSIILSTTATIGVHAMLIADSLANQQFTNFSIRKSLKHTFDPMFVYYSFFGIDEWSKKNTNSGGLLSVNIPLLLKQPFLTPSIYEQQKIASYFTTLDRQISLQTQRLEKLKQIKAACLDNMFV